MEDVIREFLRKKTEEVSARRAGRWALRASTEAWQQSLATYRARLRKIIGAVDARVSPRAPEVIAPALSSTEIAHGAGYTVFAIRWAVFDPVDEGLSGMHAEGLLLQPAKPELARIVAIPDADSAPEMICGLAAGVPPSAQFARRLAENGCQVLVPLLINREDTFSGNPEFKMTNEPHREWIYRMAFVVGRHIIGYEVQKVLAAVDWLSHNRDHAQVPIGVMGYGEGGLIALYSAALDTRIHATVVSGYFQQRENLWKEPIYRNVWGLLDEFADAEIAALVAPRSLIVEACRGPEIDAPPKATGQRANVACPNGELTTPPLESVEREIQRARAFYANLDSESKLALVISGRGTGLPGSDDALIALLGALGISGALRPAAAQPEPTRPGPDPHLRLKSQLDEMTAFTQGLVQKSSERRTEFWARADASSIATWTRSSQPLREYVWEEIIGRLQSPTLPANPRTRLIYDTKHFRGYEVMLDVWPGVVACGILLVPQNLRPGERRATVVCEHGLEGHAREVADPKIDSRFYHHFGASLAELGFVTYAPQDPFVDGERFRLIQRMAQPLKLSIYAFVLGQHQQLLKWLGGLPCVDSKRIALYGISYGGKTTMRVAPLIEGYAACICSGDFTEGVDKLTSVTSKDSFMVDDSYDLYEFDFANFLDYAELANMFAPRPFMVERGRKDPVATDDWVAFEFARVQDLYNRLGVADQLAIEYFDGGHTIHGKGTFEFLRKHLAHEVRNTSHD